MRYSCYGQMLPGQILPGHMSLWQFECVQDGSRNLALEFGWNWVSSSWDIAERNCFSGWVGGQVGGRVSGEIGINANPSLSWGWSWVELRLSLAKWTFSYPKHQRISPFITFEKILKLMAVQKLWWKCKFFYVSKCWCFRSVLSRYWMLSKNKLLWRYYCKRYKLKDYILE